MTHLNRYATRRRRLLARIALWLAFVLGFRPAPAQVPATDADVRRLQATIDSLSQRLADAERRLNSPSTPPATPAAIPPAATTTTRIVVIRQTIHDRQEAAARYGAYAIDPAWHGYLRVPNTPAIVKFDARPRLDLNFDSQNTGDPFRFVPAFLPLEDTPAYGGGLHSSVSANGTQLRFDARAPDVPGYFRFYYQNDFFGSETEPMQYRLQHLYAQYGNVTVGYTYGTFEDPDVWPDTTDYQGPNAAVYAHRATLQFKAAIANNALFTFGVEDPGIRMDRTFDPSVTLHTALPDLGANVRWEQASGTHVQAALIARTIGASGGRVPDQDKFAWGANVGTNFELSRKNSLEGLLVYGKGVGGLGNDTQFVPSDAAFTNSGQLVPLEYFSVMAGYTHHWSDMTRSTFTYGYVKLENTSGQPADAFHASHYLSANYAWHLGKRVTIGNEVLWGRREVRDGRRGDAFRFQFGITYGLFE